MQWTIVTKIDRNIWRPRQDNTLSLVGSLVKGLQKLRNNTGTRYQENGECHQIGVLRFREQ